MVSDVHCTHSDIVVIMRGMGSHPGAMCHDAAAAVAAAVHALKCPLRPDPSFQCQHRHALQATPSIINLLQPQYLWPLCFIDT